MMRTFLDRLSRRHPPSWLECHFTLILIAGAAVGMAISLGIGLEQSVWFDEAYSILLAKQSVVQLIHLTAVDTHPPLYYLLLKGWAMLFGWSGLALRSLSVLAMGAATIVSGLLVKRLFGVRAALITLPFIIFAPFLLRYGFEIRMYALASCIGVTATYLLTMAVQAKTARQQWIYYSYYAVAVALGMYTLYYTALLWTAHVVWLAWTTRHEKRSIVKAPWLLALAGSVVLFLPWLPVFVSQIGNGALAPVAQALTLENIVGIISFYFVYQPESQLNGFVSLLVVFVIVTSVYVSVRAFKIVSRTERPYLGLLACYVLVPVVLLTLISLVQPMYLERYLAHVLIGAGMFIGVSIALVTKQTGKKMRVASGGLIVAMLIGVVNLAQVGNYNFQRAQRPQAREIVSRYGCDSTTYISSGLFAYVDMSYDLRRCDLRFYATSNPEDRHGYALLHDSQDRITATNSLTATRIVLVYFNEDAPHLLRPDTRYHLMSSKTFDKTHTNVYQR